MDVASSVYMWKSNCERLYIRAITIYDHDIGNLKNAKILGGQRFFAKKGWSKFLKKNWGFNILCKKMVVKDLHKNVLVPRILLKKIGGQTFCANNQGSHVLLNKWGSKILRKKMVVKNFAKKNRGVKDFAQQFWGQGCLYLSRNCTFPPTINVFHKLQHHIFQNVLTNFSSGGYDNRIYTQANFREIFLGNLNVQLYCQKSSKNIYFEGWNSHLFQFLQNDASYVNQLIFQENVLMHKHCSPYTY